MKLKIDNFGSEDFQKISQTRENNDNSKILTDSWRTEQLIQSDRRSSVRISARR